MCASVTASISLPGGLMSVQLDTIILPHVNVTSLGDRNTASKVAVVTMIIMININIETIKRLQHY